MDILAVGKHSRHVALLCALLRLPDVRVTHESSDAESSIKSYYKRTCSIVKKETAYDLRPAALENAVLENAAASDGATTIDCSRTLKEAEQKFAEAIRSKIDLSPDKMLKESIRHLLGRNPSPQEISYHTKNNAENNIDLFAWICILNACPEAKDRGYRDFFARGQGPRIAILFAGYVRNPKIQSHAQILDYANADVFVHTWDEIGLKNERRLIDKKWIANGGPSTDVREISRAYRPCAIEVESNVVKLDSFSIVGYIRPIFLYSGQARDDATRYINSQLYSIHRAYMLMREKEDREGFRYDAILRMRFDYEVRNFSWSGILEDIERGGVYFPHGACNRHKHPGGGGGCLSCDSGVEHDRHTNDICDLWFYGSREDAAKACELYLGAFDIVRDYHEENLKALENQNSYHPDEKGFVYVSKTEDIETKYVCYYPERLLREHLKGTQCKSSRRICGRI